jgi:acetyl esterase
MNHQPNTPQIILLGDSAGGGLCFALSLRLADDAAADGADSLQVAGLITICPWVTHEFETASFTNMHGQDYLHSGVVRRASKMYIGDDNHHMHPEISVSTHPSVHLLPPTLMFYGDRELFADSIVSFADSLEEQSCEVELVKGKGMPHVYASLWPLFQPESGRAIDKMADFVLKNVSTQ